PKVVGRVKVVLPIRILASGGIAVGIAEGIADKIDKISVAAATTTTASAATTSADRRFPGCDKTDAQHARREIEVDSVCSFISIDHAIVVCRRIGITVVVITTELTIKKLTGLLVCCICWITSFNAIGFERIGNRIS